MQPAPLLHTLDNHACQWCHLTLWVTLHDLFQQGDTAVAVTVVQSAQSFDEYEFRPVLSQRESLFRESGIASYRFVAVVLEGLVGGGIERVFDMFAESGVLLEIGVGQQDGPLALRMVLLQSGQTLVGLCLPALPHVEQIEVIPGLVHLCVVVIVACQSQQLFLAQRQVVEFVLEDDARVEQPVLDDVVGGSLLLFCEWYLCQIVVALVGIVPCLCLPRLLSRLSLFLFDSLLCLFSLLLLLLFCGHHRLVAALPVVFVLPSAP